MHFLSLSAIVGDVGVVAASTCYVYSRTNNTFAYRGTLYAQAKNATECQTQCDLQPICLGFDFERNRNECYLGLTGNFTVTYSGVGVDHYIRSECPTTSVTAATS